MATGVLFPARGVAIIDALYAQHFRLAQGTDDERRLFTRMIIGQLVFEFPTDGYCGKSASPSRPFSKDAIGRVVHMHLFGWDWQNGSTRHRLVKAGDPATDWNDQNAIPVAGVNHLGTNVTTPPVVEPPVILPPVKSYPGDTFGRQIGRLLFVDYDDARRIPDADMGVWFLRVCWDIANPPYLTPSQSVTKHRNEWRKILGLSPVV